MKRFFDKVEKTGGCWNWLACKSTSGYGKFGLHGTTNQAHRVSYLWFRGSIPNGMFVLHKCDNRLCVNPEHLFIGDAKANAEDRDRKKRGVWRGTHCAGSKHHLTNLNDEKVREIREKYAAGGIGQIALAAEYGIAQSTLGAIVRRESWKHIQ